VPILAHALRIEGDRENFSDAHSICASRLFSFSWQVPS
jgi:hypothetical protein